MFLRRSLGLALSVLAFAGLTVACDEDDHISSVEGSLRSDGYALFSVDNTRQQRNDVEITVRNVRPGETYVLLYSPSAPRNAGWFLFDPDSRSRCGGDIGDHCLVDGYGWVVDVLKVPDNASQIILRDERCGCDADRGDRDWTGHWAVMRVDRPENAPESPIHFEVAARKVESFTVEPDITQLQ